MAHDTVDPSLPAWRRLSVRLAALFVAVTLLAVGLVGGLIYQRQARDVEDTLGAQLLSIARTGALLVDPALHAEVGLARLPCGAPRARRDPARGPAAHADLHADRLRRGPPAGPLHGDQRRT